MKRIAIIYFLVLVLSSSLAVYADDFPGQAAANAPQVAVSQQAGAQQPFYGYVPPPPIRHTWPGGYKVIFHEMMNTLMEHIVGHY